MSRRLAVPSTIVLTIGLLFTALPTQAGAFRDGLPLRFRAMCSRIVRADGRHEEVPSKMVSQLAAGDRLRVETAGGGGFGAAAQRDRAAVETDLADGKVSREAARKCYGWTGES